MKKRAFLPHPEALLFCCLIPLTLQAQNLPCNTFGGPNDERAYALIEGDTGWVLAGWTRSYGVATPQFKNLLILKTDAEGFPVAARISIGSDDEELRSGVRTSDGGYAFCGWTKSYGIGAPAANIIVVKLAANFALQWAYTYGGPADDYAYSIIQTHDGGLAVCGSTSSFGNAPFPNILLLRLSPAGIPMWMKVYWDPLEARMEEAYSLVELTNRLPMLPHGFIIGGRWSVPADTTWDGIVLRLDSLGDPGPRRLHVFTGAFNEGVYSVCQGESTSYAVAGWTNSWGAGAPPFANIFLARFALSGVTRWTKVIGWPAHDEKLEGDRSLIATSDRSFALCGWTQSVGPGAPPNPNFVVFKINMLGPITWTRIHPSIPGAQFEQPFSIIEHRQGGYGIAGYTNSFGMGGEDFHLLTLDQFGDRPACVDSEAPMTDTLPVRFDTIIGMPFPSAGETIPIVDTMVEYYPVCPLVGIREGNRQTALPAGAAAFVRATSELMLFVPIRGHYTLRLIDATGRQVALLANRDFDIGRYAFPVRAIESGVYYLDVVAQQRRVTVKVVRL